MSNISLPPRPNYSDAEYQVVADGLDPRPTAFTDAIRAIRRYRGIGVCIFALCVGSAGVLAWQQKPLFSAEATFRLNSRESRLDQLQSMSGRLLTGNVSDVSVTRTEVEVLQSPELIGRVVDRLGLAALAADTDGPGLGYHVRETISGLLTDAQSVAMPLLREYGLVSENQAADAPASSGSAPAVRSGYVADPTAVAREAAINRISRNLMVESVANSFLISVRYRDADAIAATSIVNTLVEIYALNQKTEKENLTRSASVWLQQQLEQSRIALHESDQAVTKFRQANGLSEVNGLTVITQQVSETTRDLNTVNTQIQQLQAEVREIERARNDPTNRLSATRFLESRIIQNLMEEDTKLARDEAEKNSVLGPNHPEIRDLRARRRTLQERLDRETNNIASAVNRSLAAARSQAAALQARLDQWSRQQGQAAGAGANLRDLEQVASVNRRHYDELLREYRDLEARERQQTPDISIVSKATPPTKGATGKVMILGGGLFGGGILTVLAMLGLAWLRNGVVDARGLARRTGLRNLGFIPEVTKRHRVKFLAGKRAAGGELTDACLAVLHALSAESSRSRGESIMVTSAVPGEGKTFTAITLARAAARSGRRTLLIDLDCRRPAIEAAVAADIASRSVATLQAPNSEVDFVMAESRTANLSYLFLNRDGSVGDMLPPKDLRYLVQSARQQYDLIVIDSPPILAASEGLALGRMADRTIMAIRWERTTEQMVISTVEAARGAGVQIDGFVLSRVDMRKHARYRLKDRSAMVRAYSSYYAGNSITYIGS